MPKTNILSITLLLLCLSISGTAQTKTAESEVRNTQSTFHSDGKAIAVELFQPTGAGRYPAVIILHGAGGLVIGGEGFRTIASYVARSGYVAVIVHYFDRTDTSVARFPADPKDFALWLKAISDAVTYVAGQPNVDPDRIGLLGISLGSYLSLALASQDPRIGTVVEYFGGMPKYLSTRIKRMPPTLILHGGADRVVPVEEAYKLEKLLQENRNPYEIKIYPSQGHGFRGTDSADALKRAIAFFDKNLKEATPKKQISESLAGVPYEYRALYAQLESRLNDFDSYLSARSSGERHKVTFAAELLLANAHRGEDLLAEKTFPAILLFLDRLQSLGVQGVKVAISYPILSSQFPQSNEYLKFYKRLADELKRRNMTMLVGAGLVFTDPTYTKVRVNYSGLTLPKYKQLKRQQLRTIIKEIRPTYVTIENEPPTEEEITGLKFQVKDFTAVVQYALKGMDRAGVLVGAGAGTWSDAAYIESLARNTNLDYIDIHLYPINRNYLERVLAFADIARSYKKKVVIGEACLYKSGESEIASGAAATSPNMFARDVFSFWAPLDEKFLDVLAKLARDKKIEFISPFWTKYFFAYLEYDEAKKRLPPAELLRLADMEASKNILAGQFSRTGLFYRQLSR